MPGQGDPLSTKSSTRQVGKQEPQAGSVGCAHEDTAEQSSAKARQQISHRAADGQFKPPAPESTRR